MEPNSQEKNDIRDYLNNPQVSEVFARSLGPATETEAIADLFERLMGHKPCEQELEQVTKEYGACGGMCFLDYNDTHLGSMLKVAEDMFVYWPPVDRA